MNKTRNSNIELLRIVCMLLIISSHYSSHGGFEAFSFVNFGFNVYFLQIISALSRPACMIFVLITGYYLVDVKNDVNYYKRIGPLILEFIFYGLLFAVIGFILNNKGLILFDSKTLIKSFFSLGFGNWFVLWYIIFYFFIPCINVFIHSIKQNEFKKLILTIILIWSIVNTLLLNAWNFGNFVFFTFSYLIGAYIKLYINVENIKNKYLLTIILCSIVLSYLTIFIIDEVGVILKSDLIFQQSRRFTEFNVIFSITFSVCTFLYFLKYKTNSVIINTISKTTTGIYLIHDNAIARIIIWEHIFPNVIYYDFPYFHFLTKILVVFIVCCIFDLMRETIYKKHFASYFDSIFTKIYNKTSLAISKWII